MCTQFAAADWAHDRRQSELTLHNCAVMAMGVLVTQDSPSTAEIEKSDHTRSRTCVVAATTRRPNHQTIWSHAAWAMSRYMATRATEPPSSPDGSAGQSSPVRLRSHQTSTARPDLEHLMRGLPCGVLASRLPPPRRDRQRSASSVPLRAQAAPSPCKVVSRR